MAGPETTRFEAELTGILGCLNELDDVNNTADEREVPRVVELQTIYLKKKLKN